jgi:hypothetical protein
MITLRVPAHLFGVLRSGFEAGACDDAPLDPKLIGKLRATLIEADVTSMPGLPVLLTLESDFELQALTACFEVGSETDADVTDDQWLSVKNLMEQASPLI